MDSENIPAEIRNKVAMLEHHRAEIKRLKQLIETSEQQCYLLESELAAYRASVAPIRKCPVEILAMIFRAYLEDNPRLIRRLILVCRLWHDLAHQTPDLWTNIPIVFDSTEEPTKYVVDSIKPRVAACIKYSRNLPLNIDLDLNNLSTSMGYIWNKARIFQNEYLQDISYRLRHDLFQHWPEYEANLSHAPWNPIHIFELLAVLTGESKTNLKRWKSFSFTVPEGFTYGDVIPIWHSLAGPLPSLVSLSINHPQDSEFDTPRSMVFTGLKSLQHMTLDNTDNMSCLDITPTTLRDLDIALVEFRNLQGLRLDRFRFLRVLKIRRSWDSWNTRQPDDSQLTLNLPELQSIAFMHAMLPPQGIKFNLPLLRNLYIQRWHPTFGFDPPSLSATSITWVICEDDDYYVDDDVVREGWTTTLKKEALKILLRRCSNVEMLTITESTEDALLSVIRDVEPIEELPPSLRIVRIASNSDEKTILRTRSLV
jgi:hypothetical protein